MKNVSKTIQNQVLRWIKFELFLWTFPLTLCRTRWNPFNEIVWSLHRKYWFCWFAEFERIVAAVEALRRPWGWRSLCSETSSKWGIYLQRFVEPFVEPVFSERSFLYKWPSNFQHLLRVGVLFQSYIMYIFLKTEIWFCFSGMLNELDCHSELNTSRCI